MTCLLWIKTFMNCNWCDPTLGYAMIFSANDPFEHGKKVKVNV